VLGTNGGGHMNASPAAFGRDPGFATARTVPPRAPGESYLAVLMRFNVKQAIKPERTELRFQNPYSGTRRTHMAARTVVISVRQASLLDQLCEFLRGAGYAVVAAASDDNPLQLLFRMPPDVDLLLADTPAAEASELARTAAAFRPGLKVLLISGDPDYVNRELIPDPAIGFIEKPFAWSSLGRRVADLLILPRSDLSCSRTPAIN